MSNIQTVAQRMPHDLFPYTTLFRSGATLCRVARPRPGHRGIARVRLCALGRTGLAERDRGRGAPAPRARAPRGEGLLDRKSTRLNSSHVENSYAVVCL